MTESKEELRLSVKKNSACGGDQIHSLHLYLDYIGKKERTKFRDKIHIYNEIRIIHIQIKFMYKKCKIIVDICRLSWYDITRR